MRAAAGREANSSTTRDFEFFEESREAPQGSTVLTSFFPFHIRRANNSKTRNPSIEATPYSHHFIRFSLAFPSRTCCLARCPMSKPINYIGLQTYLKHCIGVLPDRYKSQESNRLTLVYFTVSAFDLLDKLELLQSQRDDIIDMVYSLQVLPDESGSNLARCGFRGSSLIGNPWNPQCVRVTTSISISLSVAIEQAY